MTRCCSDTSRRQAATAEVEDALGFKFEGYLAAETARKFNSNGGATLLKLPYYEAGSLTNVSTVSGSGTEATLTEITDYDIEDDDHTYLYRSWGWSAGRYSATAKWGYGEPPTEVVELTLQKATNLFIGAQGGQYSDVVGVEGAGAVGYNRAWTHAQRAVIASVRTKYGALGFA